MAKKDLFPKDLGTAVLRGVSVYIGVALLTIVLAHVILVIAPNSDWSARLMSPVVTGIKFVDSYWKAVLLLVSPFLLPAMGRLLSRLKKATFGKEYAIDLEPEGVHQKPDRGSGAT